MFTAVRFWLDSFAAAALVGVFAGRALPSDRDGDRDIVVAAQFLRKTGWYYAGSPSLPLADHGAPEDETLKSTAPFHLYRLNPDGSGLTRITNRPDANDTSPRWSADGKTLFFARDSTAQSGASQQAVTTICRCDASGHHLRILHRLPPENYFHDLKPSPNGRYLGVLCNDLIVLDPASGRRLLRIPGVVDWEWSDSGRTLSVAGIRGKNPRLVDMATGRVSPSDLPAPVPPEWGLASDDDTYRYFRPPGLGRTAVLVESRHNRSDGGEWNIWRGDLKAGRMWPVHSGHIIAVAPDGRRCAVTDDDWVGPYKRGGARCGPLEILSTNLPPRQEAYKGRAITSPLSVFRGGDWRRPSH